MNLLSALHLVTLLLLVPGRLNNCYNEAELELTFLFKNYLQHISSKKLNFDMYTDICYGSLDTKNRAYSNIVYFKDQNRRVVDISGMEDAVMEFQLKKDSFKRSGHVSLCKAGTLIDLKYDKAAFDHTFEVHYIGQEAHLYIGSDLAKLTKPKIIKSFTVPNRHKSLVFGAPVIDDIGKTKVKVDNKNLYKYDKSKLNLSMTCLEFSFETINESHQVYGAKKPFNRVNDRYMGDDYIETKQRGRYGYTKESDHGRKGKVDNRGKKPLNRYDDDRYTDFHSYDVDESMKKPYIAKKGRKHMLI